MEKVAVSGRVLGMVQLLGRRGNTWRSRGVRWSPAFRRSYPVCRLKAGLPLVWNQINLLVLPCFEPCLFQAWFNCSGDEVTLGGLAVYVGVPPSGGPFPSPA